MTVKGLYPLSTQNGRAIPLDVVRPASLIRFDFLANTAKDIVLPADFNICYIWATRDCMLSLGAANLPNGLLEATEYPSAIFIPALKAMTLMLTPGDASLLGGGTSGSIYITAVEQWAAMLQPAQVSIG